ncbi:MAG: copper chaperone CopZ [Syntrophomonadaceae bacterium]|jgi:copper ion binding protein
MANETKILNVEGMSCMHCVNAVKNSIGSLPGISRVDVDLAGNKVAVEYDSEKVDIHKIKDKIEDAGYEVV